MGNLKAGVVGFLVNVLIGFWTPEIYAFAVCNIWATVQAAARHPLLERFNNPAKILIAFQVSCALFLYFIYITLDFVFTFIGSYLSFIGIPISYLVIRYRIIKLYSSTHFRLAELFWYEVYFHTCMWLFGSYYFALVDSLVMLGPLYANVYFVLNENHLTVLFNCLCAITPVMALLYYVCRFVLVTVGAVGTYLFSSEIISSVRSVFLSYLTFK